MSVTAKPRIEAYVGASGSGKGVSITRRLEVLKPRRLLIWDPRGEYAQHAKAVTMQQAVATVAGSKGGPFALRVVHDGKTAPDQAFGLMCKLAFTGGDMLFLAEELSDVTTASRAPPAWRQCLTQGRHKHLHILGAAQRPALIDKTFLGNCTLVRCFTLRYAPDRAAMALALDVPIERVAALQTVEKETASHQVTEINFIERDFRAGTVVDGQIVLRRKRGAT
jgi:hypothetical protein